MESNSAGDLAGAEAAGAHIDVLGRAVHHSLDALDVGLPCAVGASVGVRDLDAKGNTLVTELTFSHPLHLLAVQRFKWAQKAPQTMIAEFDTKCKHKIKNSENFLRSCQAAPFIL